MERLSSLFHSIFNLEAAQRVQPAIYFPLPTPKSVRLLDILPGAGSDVIQTTLAVVKLEDAPAFDALSYVWGSPKRTVNTLCDGERIAVTSNLGAALRRLRYPDRSRRVWIDALCINQGDLDEQAQQVSFMHNIYSRAEEVVIWLGADNGYAAKAISIIQRVAQYSREETGSQLPEQDQISDEMWKSDLKLRREIPPLGHRDWNAVYWFYKREWFSRVWIIQEAAHAKLAVMVIGELTVPWLDVAICAHWLNTKRYTSSVEETLTLTPAMTIFSIRNGGPLLWLLGCTSSFQATNPRDRVFAILGLSREGQSLEEGSLIRPNYRKQVWEAYGDVVRYLISMPKSPEFGSGGLDALGRNEMGIMRWNSIKWIDDEEDKAFPSWVPRWDRVLPIWEPISGGTLAPLWATSGDSQVETRKNAVPTSLVLRGARLATILWVDRCLELPWGNRGEEDNSPIEGLLQKTINSLPNYQGQDTLKEAFASTITAGNAREDNEKDGFHEADLEAYLEWTRTGRRTEAAYQFSISIRHVFCFFVTEDGHIGIGSRKVRRGDEVWLLFGGKVLYIVRPVRDYFKFVGECYEHGFMQGEGMEMWKAGKLKDEWLDLR
jgi:Heterokaryon incompatibility protein (HET)